MSDFIKMHPMVAELFLADGRTDEYEVANSGFSKFCDSA